MGTFTIQLGKELSKTKKTVVQQLQQLAAYLNQTKLLTSPEQGVAVEHFRNDLPGGGDLDHTQKIQRIIAQLKADISVEELGELDLRGLASAEMNLNRGFHNLLKSSFSPGDFAGPNDQEQLVEVKSGNMLTKIFGGNNPEPGKLMAQGVETGSMIENPESEDYEESESMSGGMSARSFGGRSASSRRSSAARGLARPPSNVVPTAVTSQLLPASIPLKITQSSSGPVQPRIAYMQKYAKKPNSTEPDLLTEIEFKSPNQFTYIPLGYDSKASPTRNKHHRLTLPKPVESYPEYFGGRGVQTVPIKAGRIGAAGDRELSWFEKLFARDRARQIGVFKGEVFLLEERYVRMIDGLMPGVKASDLMLFGVPLPVKDDQGGITGVAEGLDRAVFQQTKVTVRVYIVDAEIYEEMDIGSEPDPYLVIKLGNTVIDDSKGRVDDQRAPKFCKMFEMEHLLPGVGTLEITLMDHDPIGRDEVIGTTEIDIEARFFDSVYRSLPLYPVETRTLTRGENKQSLGHIRLWLEVFDPKESAKAADEYISKLQTLKASTTVMLPPRPSLLSGGAAPIQAQSTLFQPIQDQEAEEEDNLKITGMNRRTWSIGLMPPEDLELRVVVWRVDDCPMDDFEDCTDLYVTVGMPNVRGGTTKKTDTHIRSTGFVSSFSSRPASTGGWCFPSGVIATLALSRSLWMYNSGTRIFCQRMITCPARTSASGNVFETASSMAGGSCYSMTKLKMSFLSLSYAKEGNTKELRVQSTSLSSASLRRSKNLDNLELRIIL